MSQRRPAAVSYHGGSILIASPPCRRGPEGPAVARLAACPLALRLPREWHPKRRSATFRRAGAFGLPRPVRRRRQTPAQNEENLAVAEREGIHALIKEEPLESAAAASDRMLAGKA